MRPFEKHIEEKKNGIIPDESVAGIDGTSGPELSVDKSTGSSWSRRAGASDSENRLYEIADSAYRPHLSDRKFIA